MIETTDCLVAVIANNFCCQQLLLTALVPTFVNNYNICPQLLFSNLCIFLFVLIGFSQIKTFRVRY